MTIDENTAERAHQADAMAATLEAIRAILLADAHDPSDDFDADDSGAQVHVLPGMWPTLGDVLGRLAVQISS